MTKSDLVSEVAKATNKSKKESAEFVDAVFTAVQAALAKGDLPVVDGADASVYHFSGTDAQVTYGAGSHTNEPVMVYARGAGVERLKKYEGKKYTGTTLIDNTDINAFMKEITGL